MRHCSRLLGAVLLVLTTATTPWAAAKLTRYALGPYVGGYTFDGAQQLTTGTVLGLRLTADLSPALALEGVAESVRSEDAGIKFTRFAVDGLYRFVSPLPRIVPYAGVGIGTMTANHLVGGTVTKGIAGYGGGFFYRLPGDFVMLRCDLRHLVWLGKDHYSNLAYTVGLHLPIEERPPPPLPDRDRDRVNDTLDHCPDTPLGTRVDSYGCPIPPDKDRDGVPDVSDQCPDTPHGVKVDSVGCPLDGDGDKVPDYKDHCPETPAGVKVDARGCPLDSDGDTVPDYLDQCPGTPSGVKVDAKGCPLDSDGDGVIDPSDHCPGTPPGIPVDDKGCPRDSDGDGVGDTIDRCPDTPRGTAVDKIGCPIPGDSDGDGVIDLNDKCPRTPLGTRVNAAGCPIIFDGDGDGIIDAIDQCPGTRRGLVVDKFGCPPPTEEQVRINLNIQFATGKADIADKYTADLKQVGDFMTTYPGTTTEIHGHTDSQGSVALNKKLSLRRAESVRKYLLKKYDIAPERIKAIGFGSERPIAENTSADGRQRNRRIEAVIETVILVPQQ